MNVNVMEKAETPVIPGEVQRYLNIDLSPAGEAARNLNERVGYDASREEIRLSDIQGTQLAHATPGMQEWYQLYIAPSRGLALSAISQLFKERSDRAHGDGFLLASRQAAIEDGLLVSKRNCYKRHADKNYVDSQKVAQLETKIREEIGRAHV